MIIQCEKCQARFRMDPKKVGPKGVRVRCARCKNVFLVSPELAKEKDLSSTTPEESSPTPGTVAPPPAASEAEEADNDTPEFQTLFDQMQHTNEVSQNETSKSPENFTPPPASSNAELETEKEDSEKPSAFEVAAGFNFSSEKSSPEAETPNPPSKESPSEVQKKPETAMEDPFAALSEPQSPSKGSFPPLPHPSASTSEPKKLGKVKLKPSHPGLATAEKSTEPESRRELTGSPLVMDSSTPLQHLLRTLFVFSILLVGTVFSLLAMGVKPTPVELGVLFQHGYRGLKPGANLIGYMGDTYNVPGKSDQFELSGRLFNYSDSAIDQPALKLELFSIDGEFLSETSLPCCESSLPPNQASPFKMTVDMPDQKVGRYRVQIKN